MWMPKSAEEIETLATSGTLEETATFDAKGEISSNTREIAKDIDAMTAEGGVIIYGIGEDENKKLTVLSPVELAGAAERIDAIVASNISEPPDLHIKAFENVPGSGRGYLVVIVPPSARAPHMLIARQENRYYGRGPTGNRVLSQGEVERLFARRQRWEQNSAALLAELIAGSPLKRSGDYTYLYVGAWPVSSTSDLLDQARDSVKQQTLLNEVLQSSVICPAWPRWDSSPNWAAPSVWRRRSAGWDTYLADDPERAAANSAVRDPGYVLDLTINDEGRAGLFLGRAGQVYERANSNIAVFESPVAGAVTRFLWVMGQIYDKAAYLGPVDVGVALMPLRRAVPYTLVNRISPLPHYGEDEYRRTSRVNALALTDDPRSVAATLLTPFFRALTQERYDPFNP